MQGPRLRLLKLELEKKAMQTQLPAKVRTRVKEAGRASCRLQGGLLRTFLYKCVCLYRDNYPNHLFGLQSCFPMAAFTGLPSAAVPHRTHSKNIKSSMAHCHVCLPWHIVMFTEQLYLHLKKKNMCPLQ